MNNHAPVGRRTGQFASVASLLLTPTARPLAKSVTAAAVEADLSMEEIGGFFDVAGTEDEVMRRLHDGVALLCEVQCFELELRQVFPSRLAAALEPGAAALPGTAA